VGHRLARRVRQDPRPGLIVARLKNVTTGAVVSVTDEKAQRMGSEWEIVADEKPAKKPAAKPAAK